ncbi:MAG TPA: tetratricopeptide repeat protein [Anaeromyxobacteraceae bacterium]|nr:tetratricopeptide repeat protein [Anaeromyxobacteraceae bacterium]
MTPAERLRALEEKVLERPDDAFPRYGLAMCYRSLGRAEEAVSAFEELRRRHPDYVPTYLMLGQVLSSLGRVDEAVRAFEAGVALAAKKLDRHAEGELARALEELRSEAAGSRGP